MLNIIKAKIRNIKKDDIWIFTKYSMSGVISYGWNILVAYIIIDTLGISRDDGLIFTILLAFLFNFTMTYLWVFSITTHHHLYAMLFRYSIVWWFWGGIVYFGTIYFSDYLQIYYLFIYAAFLLFSGVGKFLGYHYLVFPRDIREQKKQKRKYK